MSEIADLIAERVKKQPGLASVIEDAKSFDDLKQHIGWKRLRDRIKADKDRYMAGLAKRLMAGTRVSPEELSFHRGFYAGAEWVVGHPEKAMETLDRAATIAYTLIQAEQLAEQEDQSPYA